MRSKEGDMVQRACRHRAKRTYCADQCAAMEEALIRVHLWVLGDDGNPTKVYT
jgi:hypothetical protein